MGHLVQASVQNSGLCGVLEPQHHFPHTGWSSSYLGGNLRHYTNPATLPVQVTSCIFSSAYLPWTWWWEKKSLSLPRQIIILSRPNVQQVRLAWHPVFWFFFIYFFFLFVFGGKKIPSIHACRFSALSHKETGYAGSGPQVHCSLFPRETSPRCESQIMKRRRLHKIKRISVRASLILNHRNSRQKESTHRKRPGYKAATLVGRGKKSQQTHPVIKVTQSIPGMN